MPFNPTILDFQKPVLYDLPPVTATQGVRPLQLFQAMQSFLQRAAGLQEYQVVMWFGGERPSLDLVEDLIWFSPAPESIEPMAGPGRWGNQFKLSLEVHLQSRNFLDPTQQDYRRTIAHEIYRWRLIDSIQNNNLFEKYVEQDPTKDWTIPVPVEGPPLTVESMTIGEIRIDRTQKEEGTIESVLPVTLPAVLSLTLDRITAGK